MEIVNQLEPWHWLSLGMLLLGMEIIGVGGFLLGSGVAALLMAITLWAIPDMSWQLQLVVFGIDSVALTIIYWKYFKNFNTKTDHDRRNGKGSFCPVNAKFPLNLRHDHDDGPHTDTANSGEDHRQEKT